MNHGKTAVNKALGPEEQAIVANVASLLQELQSMGAVTNTPEAEPDAEMGMAPPVMKGSEQGRTETPQNVMQPGEKPKDQGMVDWKESDEVKKAMRVIAKAMQTSQSDGPTANDSGEDRAEELPDVDEKNVNEVAKALAKMLGSKSVAKSQSYRQPQANPMEAILTVMKSMQARIDQQGAILGEVMEGLGLSAEVQAPQTVQKSQNAPYSGVQGSEMVDMIAQSVAKAMQMTGGYQQSNSGIPVAKGFGPREGRTDIAEFTEAFGQSAGWGNRPQ